MNINSTNNIKCIKIYGGDNKIIIKNIDNQVLNRVRNKFIDYKLFKEIYNIENNTLEKKYLQSFKLNMCDILPLNNKIYNSLNTHLEKITYTYNLSNTDIINLLIDYFKINDNKVISYKILFHAYKNMIEKLIEIFIKLKNDKNDKNDKTDKNNKNNKIDKLKNIWNTYSIKNNINTSSILLYFLFNKHNSIKYNLLSNSKESGIINEKINIFKNILHQMNYKYLGFCPFDYENRLHSILAFPIEELINCIKIMDKKKIYINIYNSIDELKKYIQKNKTKIKGYNTCVLEILIDMKNAIKIDKKRKINLIKIDKLDNLKLVYTYIQFIQYIFYFYIQCLPYLIKLEDNYYNLSSEIYNIINILNKI